MFYLPPDADHRLADAVMEVFARHGEQVVITTSAFGRLGERRADVIWGFVSDEKIKAAAKTHPDARFIRDLDELSVILGGGAGGDGDSAGTVGGDAGLMIVRRGKSWAEVRDGSGNVIAGPMRLNEAKEYVQDRGG